jgi:hypothetical protein
MIRNLLEACCKHQVSVKKLVHDKTMSHARVGDNFRGPAGAVWNSLPEGQGGLGGTLMFKVRPMLFSSWGPFAFSHKTVAMSNALK